LIVAHGEVPAGLNQKSERIHLTIGGRFMQRSAAMRITQINVWFAADQRFQLREIAASRRVKQVVVLSDTQHREEKASQESSAAHGINLTELCL